MFCNELLYFVHMLMLWPYGSMYCMYIDNGGTGTYLTAHLDGAADGKRPSEAKQNKSGKRCNEFQKA